MITSRSLEGFPPREWPVASSASSAVEAHAVEANPFVPMSRVQRTGILVLVAGYLAVVGILNLAFGRPNAHLLLLALIAAVVVRALPLMLYRPGYGWFHPLIFGFLLSFAQLIRDLPLYAFGLESHIALPGYSAHDLALLLAFELVLSAIGVLAYYMGFGSRILPALPRLRLHAPRGISLKTVVVVAVSFLIFVVYLSQRGGLGAHVLSWALSRHVAVAGHGYWFVGIRLGLTACLLWLAVRRELPRSPVFWAAAGTSLVLTFFTEGSRASVVYPVLLAFVVWMVRNRRVAPGRALLLVALALMALQVLGNFRRSTYAGKVDWTTLSEFSPIEAVVNMATGELATRSGEARGSLPILARVPLEVDHLYGSSYLAVLTLPVPRAIWPEKPGLVGGRVGETFFGLRAGIPPGPIGEAYWNFHIPGVLLVFFLFGIFHHWLARLLARYPSSPAIILFYVSALFLASPTGTAVINMLLTIIPIFVLARVFGLISFSRARA